LNFFLQRIEWNNDFVSARSGNQVLRPIFVRVLRIFRPRGRRNPSFFFRKRNTCRHLSDVEIFKFAVAAARGVFLKIFCFLKFLTNYPLPAVCFLADRARRFGRHPAGGGKKYENNDFVGAPAQ